MSIKERVLSCLASDLARESGRGFPRLSAEQSAVADDLARRCLVEKVFAKLRPSKRDDTPDKAAVAKFLAVNQRMRDFRIEDRRVMEWEEELYGTFKRAVYNFFYPHGDPLLLGFEQILAVGKLGAGANLGAGGTDFFTKLFSSDLVATNEALYCAYDRWTSKYHLWGHAEQTRALRYNRRLRRSGRLSCVPKNVAVSRTIDTQPTLNMFYQLGIGNVLCGRLKQAFGIHISADYDGTSVQADVNRRLARLGSRSNCLITVDLESASDSISLSLFRDCVPTGAQSWFDLTRCTHTEVNGVELELGMLSTMGNGFTFPFQTMLFSCMVEAAYRVAGLDFRHSGKDWSVYGDDIICHRDATRPLLRLLEICGFRTNPAKTFVEGPFRESCGADYIYGVNVRPVYIKSLESQEDRYVAINRLVEWCAMVGIPLPDTISYLVSTVKWRPVPVHFGQDAGIRVPINLTQGLKIARDRGNPRTPFYQGSLLVSYRSPRVLSLLVGDDTIEVPNGHKPRHYNAEGLIIGVLQGCVRAHRIGVKSYDYTLYTSKTRVAPNWVAPLNSAASHAAWRRWVDAATTLLRA